MKDLNARQFFVKISLDFEICYPYSFFTFSFFYNVCIMNDKEKSICWMGVIPESEKHRMRYPTDEEIEEAINELERLEEDE